MPKQEQSKEDKILKGLENIAVKMNEQYSSIMKKLDEHDNRFNHLEAAVMETGLNVKSLTVKVEKIDQKIDTAVTNHESRIRKLEQKVGV